MRHGRPVRGVATDHEGGVAGGRCDTSPGGRGPACRERANRVGRIQHRDYGGPGGFARLRSRPSLPRNAHTQRTPKHPRKPTPTVNPCGPSNPCSPTWPHPDPQRHPLRHRPEPADRAHPHRRHHHATPRVRTTARHHSPDPDVARTTTPQNNESPASSGFTRHQSRNFGLTGGGAVVCRHPGELSTEHVQQTTTRTTTAIGSCRTCPSCTGTSSTGSTTTSSCPPLARTCCASTPTPNSALFSSPDALRGPSPRRRFFAGATRHTHAACGAEWEHPARGPWAGCCCDRGTSAPGVAPGAPAVVSPRPPGFAQDGAHPRAGARGTRAQPGALRARAARGNGWQTPSMGFQVDVGPGPHPPGGTP